MQWLLPLLWLWAAPAVRAEEAGYALDGAVALQWRVGITADDGVATATDTLTLFCCDQMDAVVFGDASGADPTLTPVALTHLLRWTPLTARVGVHPITLRLGGSLTWSPPSGPSLLTGQSGPMETGSLTAAEFQGTLTTPFGDVPIARALVDHVGGDTSLRRYSGGIDLGPPRLRSSAVQEPLDHLEIDESDGAGRVEMSSPYETLLGVSAVRDAGSVSYPLGTAAGLFWEITISSDDGVQPPSSDTIFVSAGTGARVEGSIEGIVDPVFTPESIVHSIATTGIELQVGAHPVTLDLAGSLTWTPPAGPSLRAGQAAAMPTGDVTSALLNGTLRTPIGNMPFTVRLPSRGGDMTLTRLAGATDLGPPRLGVRAVIDPLDELEIDEADQAGRVEMRNPYQVIVGITGGVTWSMSARVVFNDAFHALLPSAPSGAVRDVTWSLHSELAFNDAFYTYDPALTSAPTPVPTLGGLGRVLLGTLLLAAGLAGRRLRGA